MPLSIQDSTLDICADDTTLSKSASWENISHINHALNQDLKRLAEWSAHNKMFINTQKTKSMLVTGKRLRNKVASLSINVNLNGNSIENVTDFKLLGITLDQDVAFDRQIEELHKKLVKRIGLFSTYKSLFKTASMGNILLHDYKTCVSLWQFNMDFFQ